MEIIDFHAHIYPDAIAAAAVQAVGRFYSIEMEGGAGTADSLLRAGDRAGISKFVVHSVATKPHHVASINRFIAEQVHLHPDRLIGYGTVHPDMEDPESVIQSIFELGLRGIKIHPDTQAFNMDDPRMFPVYELIRGKLPLLIHCGDYRYDFSHPRRLVNLLRNFPDLTVIGAHFGGWSIPEIAYDTLKDEHCYLDCSSSRFILGPRRMRELIRMFGSERMLFGSDYPMWDPADELAAFYSYGLTDRECEQILSENPKRVLGDL
ncbi:MAG: amidohydrolase family protein [Clostridia bacterium]|nr:amidohydrolase family protein [Clostridia bacterium]